MTAVPGAPGPRRLLLSSSARRGGVAPAPAPVSVGLERLLGRSLGCSLGCPLRRSLGRWGGLAASLVASLGLMVALRSKAWLQLARGTRDGPCIIKRVLPPFQIVVPLELAGIPASI